MNTVISAKYADIQPVTIRNAGLLLRQAADALDKATARESEATLAYEVASEALRAAKTEHDRAMHRLKISALQPNGGEQ